MWSLATTTTWPGVAGISHHTCRYGGKRGKPCYHATRGYDMASGLGTPQASYLVAALLREHSNAGLG